MKPTRFHDWILPITGTGNLDLVKIWANLPKCSLLNLPKTEGNHLQIVFGWVLGWTDTENLYSETIGLLKAIVNRNSNTWYEPICTGQNLRTPEVSVQESVQLQTNFGEVSDESDSEKLDFGRFRIQKAIVCRNTKPGKICEKFVNFSTKLTVIGISFTSNWFWRSFTSTQYGKPRFRRVTNSESDR